MRHAWRLWSLIWGVFCNPCIAQMPQWSPTGLPHTRAQIRESIKSLFPDRDCFTLVRPVNDEDQLARLDALPQSEMRPEFRHVGWDVCKDRGGARARRRVWAVIGADL